MENKLWYTYIMEYPTAIKKSKFLKHADLGVDCDLGFRRGTENFLGRWDILYLGLRRGYMSVCIANNSWRHVLKNWAF